MESIKKMNTPKITTLQMVYCGLFVALLAVISQISLQIPGSVPITIQVFGVALTGAILGSRLGVISIFVYILLGAAGLPVFSNFRGGFQVLTSLQGGYVIAWPLMAALCGIRFHFSTPKKNLLASLFFALIGLALVEILGAFQWAFLSGDKSLGFILVYSITAFVPKDILLTAGGILMGREILKRGLFNRP